MLLRDPNSQSPAPNKLLKAAHKQGLLMHPYTLRADRTLLPESFASFKALVSFYLFTIGVDGVFTDFPDKVKTIIEARKLR
jgi:glycerophosphoryl diester phosphodiesterase